MPCVSNMMKSNRHDAYLESRVLSADPVELVHMLYQACVQAVREARHHLAHAPSLRGFFHNSARRAEL